MPDTPFAHLTCVHVGQPLPSSEQSWHLSIPVDARTTAWHLQESLVRHTAMPDELTEGERRVAAMQALGSVALHYNSRLFPDACPDALPSEVDPACPLFLATLPDGTGRWSVADGARHCVEGVWQSRNEAMSQAWEIAESVYALVPPNPVHAVFELSIVPPDGYQILHLKNEDGSSFWCWERDGDPYEPVIEEYPSDIEARIGAWRDKLSRPLQAA